MKVQEKCCIFLLEFIFYFIPSYNFRAQWLMLESCYSECAYGYSWEGGTGLKNLKAERKWGRKGGNWAKIGQWIHQEIMYFFYKSKRATYFICKCVVLFWEIHLKNNFSVYQDTEWFIYLWSYSAVVMVDIEGCITRW